MCGIAGILGTKKNDERFRLCLQKMGEALKHRGPDGEGLWMKSNDRVGFVHRRLSIHDLSSFGSQPMLSPSERFVIVLNGEIYNFLELKKELEKEGRQFKGHSDTEVLAQLLEVFSFEDVLSRLVGMFAFAVWDQKDKILYLARDRMGEKPLYYFNSADQFVFGSELSAFRTLDFIPFDLDEQAIELYFERGYIPAPHSIYYSIRKLMPGHYLQISFKENVLTSLDHSYWSLENKISDERKNFSDEEAVENLDELLKIIVKQQLLSDVPLGAFLSSGIDSSMIVATMQSVSSTPAHTYTIGFHESELNEAPRAAKIAERLQTKHTELYLTNEDALNIIPQLPQVYGEPFADSSQIPTLLLSKLTRKHVTVSLSGDGGDEIFGGYNRHLFFAQVWPKLEMLPSGLKRLMQRALGNFSARQWAKLGTWIQIPQLEHKMEKFLNAFASEDLSKAYLNSFTLWNPSPFKKRASDPRAFFPSHKRLSAVEKVMLSDTLTYLPDDILVKVDRATMTYGLESRSPFLDHRLVEFAWSLPSSMKIRKGSTKWILRENLKKYLPQEFFQGSKRGFAVPLDQWLRGPLKEWANDLISKAVRSEHFDAVAIEKKWGEHLSGEKNWQNPIWAILMFQSWKMNEQIK
ncbi:MAG: asparagine synthase [Bacteriovoracaceae bacterium]|nr:asparagine synthase [Bacteriovoracaceae bacterium]